MDYLHELLPKVKDDDSTIEELKKLTDEQIEPIIGSLLEWLQDFNWPVAKEILPIVCQHQNVAMPHITAVLRGDDSQWIYWIIVLLVPRLTEGNKESLKSDIISLSELTGEDEDTREIVEVSKECLATCFAA
jgi:hypothetical protein